MNPHSHKSSAFSILELLVALGVIAILSTLFLVSRQNISEKQFRAQAQVELATIASALEAYRSENGTYPNFPTTELLSIVEPFLPAYPINQDLSEKSIIDPWKNPYHYQPPSSECPSYTLYSIGPKGSQKISYSL